MSDSKAPAAQPSVFDAATIPPPAPRAQPQAAQRNQPAPPKPDHGVPIAGAVGILALIMLIIVGIGLATVSKLAALIFGAVIFVIVLVVAIARIASRRSNRPPGRPVNPAGRPPSRPYQDSPRHPRAPVGPSGRPSGSPPARTPRGRGDRPGAQRPSAPPPASPRTPNHKPPSDDRRKPWQRTSREPSNPPGRPPGNRPTGRPPADRPPPSQKPHTPSPWPWSRNRQPSGPPAAPNNHRPPAPPARHPNPPRAPRDETLSRRPWIPRKPQRDDHSNERKPPGSDGKWVPRSRVTWTDRDFQSVPTVPPTTTSRRRPFGHRRWIPKGRATITDRDWVTKPAIRPEPDKPRDTSKMTPPRSPVRPQVLDPRASAEAGLMAEIEPIGDPTVSTDPVRTVDPTSTEIGLMTEMGPISSSPNRKDTSMGTSQSRQAETLIEGAEAARNAAMPYRKEAMVAREAAQTLFDMVTNRPRDAALAAEASRQSAIARDKETQASLRLIVAKKLTALAAQVDNEE